MAAKPQQPPTLQINTFGGLAITLGGAPVAGFASRKAQALLVYLACGAGPHPRDLLATLFWPDKAQARALGNLSVALSSLRKQLPDHVLADRHTVSFDHEAPHVVDCARFAATIAEAHARKLDPDRPSRTTAALLAQAVDSYQGDFLAGFAVRGAAEFEGWLRLEQERLRRLALGAMGNLVRFHEARGNLAAAGDYARRLLSIDPLEEETHRQLMRLLAADGRRAAALAQFEQCVAILDEELGVEPDEATQALARQIAAGDGLPPAGPAPTPAAAPSHNLPPAAAAFIGRQGELAQIAAWLRQPENRVITILGPGGIGKTRLAQEAARTELDSFADGVWYVSLVPLAAPDEIATTVAAVLGITLTGRSPLAEQLLDHLATRELLLILDNFEHLLAPEAVDLVAAIVGRAHDVRLLVTSRRRLNLHAELLLTLEGLPLEDPGGESGARALFANRAARVQPAFDPAAQRAEMDRLCALVDGMPLALELAAIWLRTLPLAAISAEIEQGLDILATSMRDLPQRHRSIRAVFASTWARLDPQEQQVFSALSVLRGGFTRRAARTIAGATLPLLARFVDSSLLRLDGDGRYRRHPLLLQFAAEHLAQDPPRREAVAAAHAAFFADWLATLRPDLVGPRLPQTRAAIAADLDNLRAAWHWSLGSGEFDQVATMAPILSRFFNEQSRYVEAEQLFGAAARQLSARPPDDRRDRALGRLYNAHGWFLYLLGRFDAAADTLRRGLALARAQNDRQTVAELLKDLGTVVSDQGEVDAGRALLEEGVALARTLDDPLLLVPLLNSLGNAVMGQGDYALSRQCFDEAIPHVRRLGDARMRAILDNNLGIVLNRLDDLRGALKHYSRARDAFEEIDHQWGMAATSHNIGMIHAALGEYDEARRHVELALARHESLGHRRGVVGGLSVLGVIDRDTGRYGAARRRFRQSLQLAADVGVTWSALSTLVDLGQLEMAEGNLEEAAYLLTFAIDHEATPAVSRENGTRHLDDLRAEAPAALLDRAAARAAQATLAGIIGAL